MFPPRRPVDPNREASRPSPSPQSPAPHTPTLYNPSIYSYMCRGYYYASSDRKEGSEGICRGFQSKLEVLYDEQHEIITRKEALKRFTTLTADFDYGDDYDGDTNELHQQARAVLLSPALIYKDSDLKEPDKSIHPLSKQEIPEEELIRQQEWACYGSTEVEYLVLQDLETGERKIVAVAPRNTGVSFRDIVTDDSVRSITRVGLGILDIIHESNSIMVEETEQDDTEATLPNIEESSKLSSDDMIAVAKESFDRTVFFSKLIASHTKMNAEWLSENLRDDFPARTYAAGQAIVTNLPRTVDITFQTMRKLVSQLWSDDYEDD